MEQRQSGGRTLERNKREKGASGHDGRVTHPAQGTFWFKAVNQMCPPPPQTHIQTHTPVLLYPSPDAPGGIQTTQESTESQMYECTCVCVRERENPDVSLPLPLSVSLLAWWGV